MLRLSDLVAGDRAQLIGLLTTEFAGQGFESQRTSQTQAWDQEICHLKAVAEKLLEHDGAYSDWRLLLEYEIPRRQKRPDGILLDSDILFVIEFKLGESRSGAAALWQTEEYALDLRDFHADSRERTIVPILCVQGGVGAKHPAKTQPAGKVWPVQLCDVSSLADHIIQSYGKAHDPSREEIDPDMWRTSPYRPVLTIIEAAERLFSQHDVREISHSYAGNLTETTQALIEHIRQAQRAGERRICVLTGVPGAGKTLTGLNAVHDPQLRAEGRPPAVFLSGNGPLVKIIRSALVRSSQRAGLPRAQAAREVSAFIQNVHAFLRHCLSDEQAPPAENVVVFDEAQRAWDAHKMQSKHNIRISEPDLVLQVMERCNEWCVIIALVGGGQEIHEGEAGLGAWGAALAKCQKQWIVVASTEALVGGQSVAGQRLFPTGAKGNAVVLQDDRLHLKVSTRSWRAHKFNEWVNDVLALRSEDAANRFRELREFPIVMTRNLDAARQWLRDRSGLDLNRRCGLVASSGAARLRAYGIEVSTAFRRGYPYDHWFLAGPEDVRSSFRLEVAATEFEVQGLELDWVGLCWGNDLHVGPDNQWMFRRFAGTKWLAVRAEAKRQYMINKYRVLLTRARQGVVIWIPEGFQEDPTLEPESFSATYNYLRACGIREIAPLQ